MKCGFCSAQDHSEWTWKGTSEESLPAVQAAASISLWGREIGLDQVGVDTRTHRDKGRGWWLATLDSYSEGTDQFWESLCSASHRGRVLDIFSSSTEEVLRDGNEGAGVLGLPKSSFACKHSPK